MKKILTIILILIHLISYGQSIEDAKLLLANYQFEEAFPIIQNLAANGSPEANYYLGIFQSKANWQQSQNLKEAQKSFKKASKQGIAKATFQMGKIYFEEGKVKKATPYFNECYSQLENEANEGDAEAARYLAYLYQHGWEGTGKDYVEAQKWYEVAISLWDVYALNELGELHTELNDYAEAEALYQKSLDYFPDSSDLLIETKFGLANVYYKVGRYIDAEKLYEDCLEYYESTFNRNYSKYGQVVLKFANMYTDLGEYDDAEFLYKDYYLLVISQLDRESVDYANVVYGMAGVHWLLNRNITAKDLFLESLELYKKIVGKDSDIYIQNLVSLGKFFRSQDKFQESEQYLKEAIELTEAGKIDCYPCYIQTIEALGNLYQNQEYFSEALQQFEKALSLAENELGNTHPSYSEVAFRLVKYYIKIKDYEQAEYYFDLTLESSISYIEEVFPSLSDDEKAFLYGDIQEKFEFYDNFVLFFRSESPELFGKMYNYQLFTKALFLNLTNRVKNRILNSQDEELITLYYGWLQQKEEIAQYSGLNKDELASRGIDLRDLKEKSIETERELAIKSEDFAQSNENKRHTWQEIQNALGENEIAIEMIRIRQADWDKGVLPDSNVVYVALIISPDKTQPEAVLIEEGLELETKYYHYYRNSIYAKRKDKITYKKYWQTIEEKIEGNPVIYFSPDGIYNQINLNTIPFPGNKKFLVDEYDFHFLNNTREILSFQDTQEDYSDVSSSVILIGRPTYSYSDPRGNATSTRTASDSLSKIQVFKGLDALSKQLAETPWADLKGTEREVRGIADVLKKSQKNWNIQTFLGEQASEKQVKSLSNPRILHIATHGFFIKPPEADSSFLARGKTDLEQLTKIKGQNSMDAMLRSGVVLANVATINRNLSEEDGLLTAYELSLLNLNNTSLLILSACETGRGQIRAGEGVYGLQRAAQIAGVSTIMMSLWKVDDTATQELMNIFYEEWEKTNHKREAFKKAQLLIREKHPDPYYWGAFVLIGE